MQFFQVTTFLALLLIVLLGCVVYALNPARRAHRMFLLTSFAISLWLISQFIGAGVREEPLLLFWIRQASATAALIPMAFDLMRLAIQHPDMPWRRVAYTAAPWVVLLGGVMVLCQTDYFVYGLMPGWTTGFAHPAYGPGLRLYIGYWGLALALLVGRFSRSLYQTRGLVRTELGFILLAAVLGIVSGVTIYAITPLLGSPIDLVQIMPFLATFLTMGTIAYGIATRRIMSVSAVVQTIMAYAALGIYLSLLYLLLLYGGRFVLRQVNLPPDPLASLFATLAVAFSMIPLHGRLQTLVDQLLNRSWTLTSTETLQQAHAATRDLGTCDEIIDRFITIITRACDVESLWVVLAEENGFRLARAFPAERAAGFSWPEDSACVRYLRSQRAPLSPAILRRMRESADTHQAARELQDLRASAAIGIYDKQGLSGLLILGTQKSGGYFTSSALEALQMIADHLSVALDNTRLYREVQNARIYHEILLNSLSIGIIAIDVKGRITVCNREAARITGLSEDRMIGHDYACLPSPLQEGLRATLESGVGLLDETISLEKLPDPPLPLRINSSLFHAHTGERLGVLLVFQDIGLVRQLEEQIRRTDRLSSLGTLSAGMAHEIKNPLVTIKTFTQLFPERYGDPEFRETFTALVGQEVERIDSIVNRLLHFARPAPAALSPIGLHRVIQHSLRLVEQALRTGRIQLRYEPGAIRDRILGDQDQLCQALVNFYLNALHAMPGEGTLEVATRDAPGLFRGRGGSRKGVPSARIRLSIRDTGGGIAEEDLSKIFDPFFSRNPNGTGLGLSIAHGIIQEHKASIEVESRVGEGTVFHLLFPLLEEDPA